MTPQRNRLLINFSSFVSSPLRKIKRFKFHKRLILHFEDSWLVLRTFGFLCNGRFKTIGFWNYSYESYSKFYMTTYLIQITLVNFGKLYKNTTNCYHSLPRRITSGMCSTDYLLENRFLLLLLLVPSRHIILCIAMQRFGFLQQNKNVQENKCE